MEGRKGQRKFGISQIAKQAGPQAVLPQCVPNMKDAESGAERAYEVSEIAPCSSVTQAMQVAWPIRVLRYIILIILIFMHMCTDTAMTHDYPVQYSVCGSKSNSMTYLSYIIVLA
jgi:hypothetical protein